MKVYGTPLSPFARKVQIVLAVKGLAFECDPLIPGAPSPEFLKLSPLGKIPALEDGGIAMADSTVICEYLDERYPAVRMMPDDAVDRARARWLEEYADTKLMDLFGVIFFERVIRVHLMEEEADEHKVMAAIEKLVPVMDYLEAQLPTDGYLFASIGTADIAIFSQIHNGVIAGYQVDNTRWPKVHAFLERVGAYPAVARQLEAEAKSMEAISR